MHNASRLSVHTLLLAKPTHIRKKEVAGERQKTRLPERNVIHTEELTPEQLSIALSEGFDPIAVSALADDIPS